MTRVNSTTSFGDFCEKSFTKSSIWRRSAVFFVNFEQILHMVLLHNGASIVGFVQLNTSWIDNSNPLSAISTEWSNTLKQFADELFECVWPFCGVGL